MAYMHFCNRRLCQLSNVEYCHRRRENNKKELKECVLYSVKSRAPRVLSSPVA